MKKRHIIAVRGKQHEWVFETQVDPQYVEEWRADGLDIHAVENTVPVWVANLGMVRAWCFFQDLFHLKNPFRR